MFSGINAVLDKIAALSYPVWLSDAAPFLPEFDLTCIATSGAGYLDDAAANATLATVTGFLGAVTAGCSLHDFLLSGGYSNERQELEINIVLETSRGGNL